jgi:(1->4)-alpha-D-glucan 1-alpha-D-glucosylmutase
MEKSLREAKIHTSWINPNNSYDEAVRHFVAKILDPSPNNAFLEDFIRFQALVASAGLWNSVSQVLLKITSPGVPDLYQGNELWCFNLVDPDNRGPVDFELRRKILAKQTKPGVSRTTLVEQLATHPCDGAIKLYITSQALKLRKESRDLFARGSYLPLTVEGDSANHAVGFARTLDGKTAIVLVGRFFLRMMNSSPSPPASAWKNTTAWLPPELAGQNFRDAFTDRSIPMESQDGKTAISLETAFSSCPVAFLLSQPSSDIEK